VSARPSPQILGTRPPLPARFTPTGDFPDKRPVMGCEKKRKIVGKQHGVASLSWRRDSSADVRTTPATFWVVGRASSCLLIASCYRVVVNCSVPTHLALIHALLFLLISTIESAVGKRLVTHCCVSRLACSHPPCNRRRPLYATGSI